MLLRPSDPKSAGGRRGSVGARLERPDQGGQVVKVSARESVAIASPDRGCADESSLSELLEVIGDE